MDFKTGIKNLGYGVFGVALLVALFAAISAAFTVGTTSDKFYIAVGIFLLLVVIAGIVLVVKKMNKSAYHKE